jgi:hypothetical protein
MAWSDTKMAGERATWREPPGSASATA